jgi:hypothetical protein
MTPGGGPPVVVRVVSGLLAVDRGWTRPRSTETARASAPRSMTVASTASRPRPHRAGPLAGRPGRRLRSPTAAPDQRRRDAGPPRRLSACGRPPTSPSSSGRRRDVDARPEAAELAGSRPPRGASIGPAGAAASECARGVGEAERSRLEVEPIRIVGPRPRAGDGRVPAPAAIAAGARPGGACRPGAVPRRSLWRAAGRRRGPQRMGCGRAIAPTRPGRGALAGEGEAVADAVAVPSGSPPAELEVLDLVAAGRRTARSASACSSARRRPACTCRPGQARRPPRPRPRRWPARWAWSARLRRTDAPIRPARCSDGRPRPEVGHPPTTGRRPLRPQWGAAPYASRSPACRRRHRRPHPTRPAPPPRRRGDAMGRRALSLTGDRPRRTTTPAGDDLAGDDAAAVAVGTPVRSDAAPSRPSWPPWLATRPSTWPAIAPPASVTPTARSPPCPPVPHRPTRRRRHGRGRAHAPTPASELVRLPTSST